MRQTGVKLKITVLSKTNQNPKSTQYMHYIKFRDIQTNLQWQKADEGCQELEAERGADCS